MCCFLASKTISALSFVVDLTSMLDTKAKIAISVG